MQNVVVFSCFNRYYFAWFFKDQENSLFAKIMQTVVIFVVVIDNILPNFFLDG